MLSLSDFVSTVTCLYFDRMVLRQSLPRGAANELLHAVDSAGEPDLQGNNEGHSDMDWEQLHDNNDNGLDCNVFGFAPDVHDDTFFGDAENEFTLERVDGESLPLLSMDDPADDVSQQGGFVTPTPKAQASGKSRQVVDMDVSRTINSLVMHSVAESPNLPAPFWNQLEFDHVYSLDNIWRQPQLPSYGRFEAVHGIVHNAPSLPDAPPHGLSDFKRKRLLATAFAKTDDQLVDCAMRQLKEIVLFQPQDSRLGRALLDVSGKLVPETAIATSFIDAVAGKAPGTIAKHVADYHRFARWAVDGGRCYPMNISETVVYDYAKYLQMSGGSATSLQSFIKAIGFFEHHIGFAKVDVAHIISGCVAGVSRTMLAGKRELKQAPPLTADGLYALEKYVCNCNDVEACIGGFLIFCLLASARFADAARAESVHLDMSGHISLLETSTMKFKTAHTAGKEARNVALPMLALGNGLYEQDSWAWTWIRARKRQKLDDFKCLMPAWNETTSSWLNRPMTSGEGAYFLRELLCLAGMDVAQAATYSTHTLKATALSWAATSGAMTIDERRIMGHHFDSRLAMPLIYSRDALAEIQTKLWRVLDAIRKGYFDPDSSRAARIAAQTLQEAEQWDMENYSDESVDPIEIGACESLSGPQNKKAPHSGPLTEEIFKSCLQHIVSGILHVALDTETLACSRKVSSNYKKPTFDFETACDFPFCVQCAQHS